jgi:Cu(I)/Ag(I) efflux system membrane fusion protein
MMNPEGGKTSMVHDHGSMDMGSSSESMENSNHQMAGESGETISIDPAFRDQLNQVYEKYLSFKNALVSSDPDAALKEQHAMETALEKTDMSLLEGDAHMAWMKQLNKMNEALELLDNQTDLELQRRVLAPISDALYQSISQIGIQTGTIYYQYCPMAMDNKGAFWLSELDEIANPYFGDMMLRCGETRDTIEFK